MIDLILHGGQIVDGTGRPGFAADVAVVGNRIEAIGLLEEAEAVRRIDVRGLIVAPGFIDPHVHSEIGLLAGTSGAAASQQGVTTHLLGPDGFGYAPLSPQRLVEMRAHLASIYGEPELDWNWASMAQYLRHFEGQVPVNVVAQVSHHAVRLEVLGWEARPAQPEELARMLALTRQALDDGAVAMSVGLDYLPGLYSTTTELAVLCQSVVERGGLYTAHQRHAAGVLAGTRETLQLAATTGIPVHISHLYGDEALFELIERAAADGVDVTFDAYPYTAGCAALTAFLPTWVQAGAPADVLARLREASVRQKLAPELAAGLRPDWSTYLISGIGSGPNRDLQGRSLANLAGADAQSLTDLLCDLLVAENLNVLLIDFWLDDVLVRRSLTHPLQMVMSDGMFLSFPHPRGYGTYPRVLGHYVREERLLSLEDAVRRMTGFPAQRFGLRDRGEVKETFAADLTVFDPNLVCDCATYIEPEKPPQGIPYVLVNGQFVVDQGRVTGARPGRVLKPLLESHL